MNAPKRALLALNLRIQLGKVRRGQLTLIVRAPDFIHRQLGGYPFATRPVGQSSVGGRRYVTFTGVISNVEITDIRSAEIRGAVGGRVP